jgi:hypothetical protein
MLGITRKRVRTFFRLDFGRKVLLMEAFLSLGIARAALLTMEFRHMAPWLGRREEPKNSAAETGAFVATRQKKLGVRARRVGWAIRTMSRYTPWESKCLVQAMAAKIMLNRRKIGNTLYLGVAKDGTEAMVAHAWVKCGGIILTGARQAERFTAVAAFSSR